MSFTLAAALLRPALPVAPPNPIPSAGVALAKVENGATVMVRRDTAPPLAVVDLWVRAGSVDDGGTGAAHALEHMVFKGSAKVPAGKVDATVEESGGVVYAATFPDATHYWAAVPPDRVRAAADALVSLMAEPALDPAEWEKERRVMLEEIARSQSDAVAEARRALAAKLYGPAYASPVAGTSEALKKLTPEGIRAFYRAAYRPDRMALVVVGNVDADATKKTFTEALGRLPKAANGATGTSAPKASSGVVDASVSRGGDFAVGIGFAVPPGDSPAVDVLCALLRARVLARLGGISDTVEVTHPWQRAGMVLLVAKGEQADAVRLRAVLRQAVTEAPSSVTAAEVASVVYQRQWQWWLSQESPGAQAQALGLAAALGDAGEATDAIGRLSAVTVEDVRAAARTLSETLSARGNTS